MPGDPLDSAARRRQGSAMLDLRPVGYVIGLLTAVLGATMAVPMAIDVASQNGHWPAFLQSAILTCLMGGLMAIACANGVGERLTLQQTFLLATGVWVALPLFGALPFLFGATGARTVDAVFEAMSGLTTTGATVFTGLEDLPAGLLLWRSMLQWFGGIGIIVVAMVFLPELRVGGMQIFRSEAFDTGGKVLPRAAQIASRIIGDLCRADDPLRTRLHERRHVRLRRDQPCADDDVDGRILDLGRVFRGLSGRAGIRRLGLHGPGEPALRTLCADSGRRVGADADAIPRCEAFLWTIAVLVAVITAYRILANGDHPEHAFREAVFNVTSIITGTGYASVDYQLWGPFPIVLFFFIGLIGGCAGSTCCSVKIFRYQLLIASVGAQIRRIHSPNGLFTPRYQGQPVTEEVMSSVMAFLGIFVVSLGADRGGAVSDRARLRHLDFRVRPRRSPISDRVSARSSAPRAISRQSMTPRNGSCQAAMLLGRLELLVVLVIFLPRFWRN